MNTIIVNYIKMLGKKHYISNKKKRTNYKSINPLQYSIYNLLISEDIVNEEPTNLGYYSKDKKTEASLLLNEEIEHNYLFNGDTNLNSDAITERINKLKSKQKVEKKENEIKSNGSNLGILMLKYLSTEQENNNHKEPLSISYSFSKSGNEMISLPFRDKSENYQLSIFEITNTKIFNNISNYYTNKRKRGQKISEENHQEEEDIDIFGSEEENSFNNNIENNLNKDRVSFFNKDKSIDDKFESIKNINLKDLLNN